MGGSLCTTSKKIRDHNVLLAEVLATSEAIVSTIRTQMKQVIIESDSLVIVKAINGEATSPRVIGNIVEDVKMLPTAVRNIKFVHCNRSTNILVDMLAKKAHSYCT